MIGAQAKARARRVIVDPGLKLVGIEALDKKAEVDRRSIDAMDEQNRDLDRIVGLQEVDPWMEVEDKIEWRPQTACGVFQTEARFIESDDGARGGQHSQARGQLVLRRARLQRGNVDIPGYPRPAILRD